MAGKTPITVAHGDGIGPEIMNATLRILDAAGAELEIETIEIGAAVYERGNPAGIEDSALDSLRRTGVFLKAPITTPQGGGFKSLNVTVRKTLGLFANVRPCPSYFPFVATKHPNMDVVIIRENEEDLYAGIEHRQTDDVVQCLKLITRPGCERIARYAFEYARAYNRKKVTAFTKDNIMKMTDGMFHQVAEEVAKEYDDIEFEHWIVDIGAAKLADNPNLFDVILLPNLYGDILSDVAAEIAGSVGMAGSANIGETSAMFEAIHGSAPLLAGKNTANPSGLILGAVQMLVHIGQGSAASIVHNAWLTTIEQGVHTNDVNGESTKEVVGTKEFADAVIARIGQKPETLPAVNYDNAPKIEIKLAPRIRQEKKQVGIDVFIDAPGALPDELGNAIEKLATPDFKLDMISNRGQKVYPHGAPETTCVDHWRLRFSSLSGETSTEKTIQLLERLCEGGFPFVKTEGLFSFDGELGFTRGQGQ